MNVLVQNSDTSTLGGGGIPPMIDTKTTAGGSVPDYSAMMTQNVQLIAALAILQANPTGNITTGTGAGTGRTVINHQRQWVHYCYKCGVNLKHNSIDCSWKENIHKDDAAFADK